MATAAIPVDWYRTSFAEDFQALYFEEGGKEKAELALLMLGLGPAPGLRVLDLACGIGGRTLELSRIGFDVLGVDPQSDLLEVAGGEAKLRGLWPHFAEADTRDLEFKEEFDVVLSLGGGAFEHFGDDDECLRAFAAAARALRPGGRLLMQTPNVLFAERHLPESLKVVGGGGEDTIRQHWDDSTRYLTGVRVCRLDEDPDWPSDEIPINRRLYSVEELATVFESVGLALSDVYDERGDPCAPSDTQLELYVEARK